MKLNKFAYLYSKPLGNHTLKIMKKIPGNIMEISWNFVSPKKVGTLTVELALCGQFQLCGKAVMKERCPQNCVYLTNKFTY